MEWVARPTSSVQSLFDLNEICCSVRSIYLDKAAPGFRWGEMNTPVSLNGKPIPSSVCVENKMRSILSGFNPLDCLKGTGHRDVTLPWCASPNVCFISGYVRAQLAALIYIYTVLFNNTLTNTCSFCTANQTINVCIGWQVTSCVLLLGCFYNGDPKQMLLSVCETGCCAITAATNGEEFRLGL